MTDIHASSAWIPSGVKAFTWRVDPAVGGSSHDMTRPSRSRSDSAR